MVRSGREGSNQGGSLPVGFVLLSHPSSDSRDGSSDSYGYDWIFVRRYDRQTEEVSNEPLDEVTCKNLMLAISEENGELNKFVMPYVQFMGSDKNIHLWKARTTLVDESFLSKQHSLAHGNKIIPSSDTSCDPEPSGSATKSCQIDGTSVNYPPIPCIDRTINARMLTQHSGTKAYLSGLSPNLRTWLLFGGKNNITTNQSCASPEEYVWNDVLKRYYSQEVSDSAKKDQYFLADIQFAFLVFLFLECHSSLEHWRDAVSMSSLTTTPSTVFNKTMIHQPAFTLQLLSTLYAQLVCIEADFFQEVEYSSGESNFLIGALRRLCFACVGFDGTDETISKVKETSLKLQKLAEKRFHVDISQSAQQHLMDECYDIDMINSATPMESNLNGIVNRGEVLSTEQCDESTDDEDGPVVVSSSDVEASIARSSKEHFDSQNYSTLFSNVSHHEHRQSYPLLYAAITPQEDVVMACARILDARNDVSLVREAAAYLEEVEAYRID